MALNNDLLASMVIGYDLTFTSKGFWSIVDEKEMFQVLHNPNHCKKCET